MRSIRLLALFLVALSTVGGTCAEAPPYHDLSGTWTNATWGPEATLASAAGDVVDLDLAMDLQAAVPQGRTAVPVSGHVCVSDPRYGLSGTYTVDPTQSTWAGADYGGARLDLVARDGEGRTVAIDQAFMHNASPEALQGSIIELRGLDGTSVATFRFEDFARRSGVTCP